MIRKQLMLGLVFSGMLAMSASAADVVIRVAPPRAVVERRGPPPSRSHVWVSGYHHWDGNRYVWTPGRWEQPPHRHAHWVAPRWVHRGGGWVFVEGRWR